MKPATRPATTPLPWAAARLRLGQANVGFWVVVALGVVGFTGPAEPSAWTAEVRAWAVLIGLYVLAQAGFDVVGGYVLPVAHERRVAGLARWLRSWLSGVGLHAGCLFLVGVSTLTVARAFGDVAAFALSIGFAAASMLAQGMLARQLAAATSAPDAPLRTALQGARLDASRAVVVHTDDSGFVGGWVGLPGRETLLVPSRWTSLPGAELHAALTRRRLARASGSRLYGLIGGMAFNVVGVGVVLGGLPGAGFQSATGLLVTSAGFTLWTFFGILTLPSISRWAVTALDRQTVAALGEPRSLAAAVTHLDRHQEDEGRRAPWTETIFHPVPARADRIAAFTGSRVTNPGMVPWRITRMALFGGWAHVSWLSRSVHCNIGRPELWAVYPGD